MKLCLQLFVAFVAFVAVAECQNADCKANGSPCERDSECCSKTCMFYAHKCVSSGPLGPAIPEKTTNKETSKNEIKKSSNPVNRIKVINEFKPKNECGKHGDPCVSEEECCSGLRCHKYAKRCQVILPEPEFKAQVNKLG
ncbi:uncharacterized protein LOC113383329 [Ctenocephalides felis]|uniref:uncharacterized protein LOC113367821 n=1 Tax=Ctenocephalides felis TaxID=7515 RepID=UPI000E6E5139|nr:uncharacterized protein LOC113367821 [Ctenocephalides felis]XP_026477388.1 uncharacterized protein LOC113383329 [Ctenocephalides felis]